MCVSVFDIWREIVALISGYMTFDSVKQYDSYVICTNTDTKKMKRTQRNPQFPHNATQVTERRSGNLILLTCQSNPGPAIRGSWLLAFSPPFVTWTGLHFDLIKPKGMASNENQSSRCCKLVCGWMRTAWLAHISTIGTPSLASPLIAIICSFAHNVRRLQLWEAPCLPDWETCLHDHWQHKKEGLCLK